VTAFDPQYSDQRGMTLIEVMVALVILALVASGVLALVGQNTRFVSAAQDRLIASILADNLMVEELVQAAPPEEGEEMEEHEFAGREWVGVQTTTVIDGASLIRVDIEVKSVETGQVLAVVSTLKAVQ